MIGDGSWLQGKRGVAICTSQTIVTKPENDWNVYLKCDEGKFWILKKGTLMPYPCRHFYFDIKFGDKFIQNPIFLSPSVEFKKSPLWSYHNVFILTNQFQPRVLLFLKKSSRTISQHFNMEKIGTSAPRSAMKMVIVAPKIQVRVHSKFEFRHSAIQTCLQFGRTRRLKTFCLFKILLVY